jgi:hypothetical protein
MQKILILVIISAFMSAGFAGDSRERFERIFMATQGFFAMGELTGHSYRLMTSNDNPLHGFFHKNDISEYGEGLEGDDLGNTFGGDVTARAEFENGSVALRSYTKVYGRLAPQQIDIEINGVKYPVRSWWDEEGKIFAESLSIDGVELEVVRDFGDDIYVRLIGGIQKRSDQEGLGQEIQDNWHDIMQVYRYHYVDHFKDEVGANIFAEVAKEWELYRAGKNRISFGLAVGGNLSTFGDEESYGQLQGEVKYRYMGKNVTGEEYASWELRGYLRGKKYGDGEDGNFQGMEITKRFAIGKRSYFYLQGGIAQENDRLDREYGVKVYGGESGTDDYQHYIGGGIEIKH